MADSNNSGNNPGMTSQQLQELVSEVNRLRSFITGQAQQNEEMEQLKEEVKTSAG